MKILTKINSHPVYWIGALPPSWGMGSYNSDIESP